ncbi:hypothetical protein BG011_007019, partial [Mortierella polycephala]
MHNIRILAVMAIVSALATAIAAPAPVEVPGVAPVAIPKVDAFATTDPPGYAFCTKRKTDLLCYDLCRSP